MDVMNINSDSSSPSSSFSLIWREAIVESCEFDSKSHSWSYGVKYKGFNRLANSLSSGNMLSFFGGGC